MEFPRNQGGTPCGGMMLLEATGLVHSALGGETRAHATKKTIIIVEIKLY